MSSLWDLHLSQLQDRVASLEPTPGGGSVSVVSAVLGLSLVQKGIRVSLRKVSENSAARLELTELDIRASSAMEPLKRYADADTQAFRGYLQAAKLPQLTEEEKQARKKAMEEALLHASRIPLEAAAQMKLCLGIAEGAIRLAKESVLSDIAAGALLIRSAIDATLLNVDSNLAGISDAVVREGLTRRRMELETAASPRTESVLQELQKRMGKSPQT